MSQTPPSDENGGQGQPYGQTPPPYEQQGQQPPAGQPYPGQGYPTQAYPAPGYQQPGYQQPGYQQPGYQQPGYPQQYAGARPRPNNTMAIVSMIAGIAGLVAIPIAGSIVALITGSMARKQIAQTGEEGGGLATAGIIMGWIGVVLWGLGILLWIVVVVIGLGMSAGMSGY